MLARLCKKFNFKNLIPKCSINKKTENAFNMNESIEKKWVNKCGEIIHFFARSDTQIRDSSKIM